MKVISSGAKWKMIEYSIAQKEHLPRILELYKQLLPDENPMNKNTVNER
jgi:hypothetical protein